jgi:hypothetical protein
MTTPKGVEMRENIRQDRRMNRDEVIDKLRANEAELRLYLKGSCVLVAVLAAEAIGLFVVPVFVVDLGKLGGSKGGRARAAALTQEELSAIGRMGGNVGGNARAQALSSDRKKEIAAKAAAARRGKKATK